MFTAGPFFPLEFLCVFTCICVLVALKFKCGPYIDIVVLNIQKGK